MIENNIDWIQTVKQQENGYLVNGYMSVPKADGNREYELIKQWLAEGNTPEAEFTDEEIASAKLSKEVTELKSAKNLALSSITVTVGSNTFDGNEAARSNMTSAILSAEVIGSTESPWKLADNSIETITIDELKQALALSIQEVGRIVMTTSKEEL